MILLSGGMDPVHPGHVRYITEAKRYGKVVVALNSDDWLKRKKGYCFMRWEERQEILQAMGVSCYRVDDLDGTVCEAIRSLKPEFFANGGDRNVSNTPEVELCVESGVKLIWGCGGDKFTSSSELIKRASIERRERALRQWGSYEVLDSGNGYKVKMLILSAGAAISVQRHARRSEHWIFPDTSKHRFVDRGEVHQLKNETNRPLRVIEVQIGECEESDIERLSSAP